MSYVEKAFWDYLKTTIFGGIRILLSRRLILFSLILFISSIFTTTIVVLQGQISNETTKELLNFTFLTQISIAIGFITAGIFSKKMNTLIRIILLFLVFILVQIMFFLSSSLSLFTTISNFLIDFIPLISLIIWAFLVPVASFSFSKGLFSNKITGSILFLGKPKTDRKSIFSGLMTIIAFISFLWNLLMIYIGIDENLFSYLFLGILGAIVAWLIILIVQGLIIKDDVFNSIIGFFFIISLPNQIMIFLTSLRGSENIVTSFDYIMVLFSLIYTAQNISRRIKMKGVVHDSIKKSQEMIKEDPYRIGRFIGFVGGEGVVLIFLGLALGFQVFQLQLLTNLLPKAIQDLIGVLTFSEVYHDITMIFMAIILGLILISYIIQRGKGYWEPDIYRFDFLPPYEDLINYIERIKRGEISPKDIVFTMGRTVGKKAIEKGGAGILSTAKKLQNMIIKGKEESE